VPRRLLHNADLVLAYASRLHLLGEEDEAEALLRATLKKNWDDRLVALYGQLQGKVAAQLATAEDWLRERDRNPVLLLALGRLAMRNSLWGKARGYLEASIGSAPTIESYQLLGMLAEQLNDTVLTTECYRQAVRLATGEQALIATEQESGSGLVLSPPLLEGGGQRG
jgi:HemY protein